MPQEDEVKVEASSASRERTRERSAFDDRPEDEIEVDEPEEPLENTKEEQDKPVEKAKENV